MGLWFRGLLRVSLLLETQPQKESRCPSMHLAPHKVTTALSQGLNVYMCELSVYGNMDRLTLNPKPS